MGVQRSELIGTDRRSGGFRPVGRGNQVIVVVCGSRTLSLRRSQYCAISMASRGLDRCCEAVMFSFHDCLRTGIAKKPEESRGSLCKLYTFAIIKYITTYIFIGLLFFCLQIKKWFSDSAAEICVSGSFICFQDFKLLVQWNHH